MKLETKPLPAQALPPGTASISKLDIVKRDLPPALEEFGDRPIYFMQFRSCNETRSLIRESGRAVARRILGVEPLERGASPMASVLRDAAAAFRAAPDRKYYGNILIVTDTGAECDEDPCSAAREIAAQKPGIAINVVDLENSESLRCVSEATGGKFFARGSQLDLRQMIQEAKTFQASNCPPDGASAPAVSPPTQRSGG